MKQVLLILIIMIAALAGAIFFIAIPKAESKVENAILALGFSHADVKSATFHSTGLKIKSIALDQDGFNHIDNIKINLYWPRFLTSPTIDRIHIEQMNLSYTANELKRISQAAKTLSTLSGIKAKHIILDQLTIDVAGSQKAYRFSGHMDVKSNDEQQIYEAALNAQQHELSFNSQWQGQFNKETNQLKIDGLFEALQINSKILDINRGAGWLSYESVEESNPIISAQFDAGSGNIFSVPAQNINLVIGQNGQTYPILFRANATGMDDVKLTSDLIYSQNQKEKDLTATLKIPDLNEFLSYLKAQNILPESIKSSLNSIDILLEYQEEKRFAGGPLPFDIYIDDEKAEQFSGTFLIYPDSLDIRGTSEGSSEMIDLLTQTLPIAEEDVNDNFIRLDGNIKSVLH